MAQTPAVRLIGCSTSRCVNLCAARTATTVILKQALRPSGDRSLSLAFSALYRCWHFCDINMRVMIEPRNQSRGMMKVAAPLIYKPFHPPQPTGCPGATTTRVGHGVYVPQPFVQRSPVTNPFIRTAHSAPPVFRPPNTASILQRTAVPKSAGATRQSGPPVYKVASNSPSARVVQPSLWGLRGGESRHAAALSGSAGDIRGNHLVAIAPVIQAPVVAPLPRTSFPASKTDFTASEIETLFSEGQLTLGVPRIFPSLFLEGRSYSQNYAYDLSYNGKVIGVLHVHYNTDNPSEVKTAYVGLSKIKKADRDRVPLAYSASSGLIAAARTKHP